MVVLLVGGVGNYCGKPKCLGSCMGWRLNRIWLKLRILGLIMKRKNLFMCVKMKISTNVSMCSSFVGVPYCLEEKLKKNVFKNLTEMLMCLYRGDVAEWISSWYCSGYGLVSNFETVLKYYIWKKCRVRVWWVVTYLIVVRDWKKWNLGGGTRCEEGVNIRGQS